MPVFCALAWRVESQASLDKLYATRHLLMVVRSDTPPDNGEPSEAGDDWEGAAEEVVDAAREVDEVEDGGGGGGVLVVVGGGGGGAVVVVGTVDGVVLGEEGAGCELTVEDGSGWVQLQV